MRKGYTFFIAFLLASFFIVNLSCAAQEEPDLQKSLNTLEKYRNNIRNFKNKMDSSLYGNTAKDTLREYFGKKGVNWAMRYVNSWGGWLSQAYSWVDKNGPRGYIQNHIDILDNIIYTLKKDGFVSSKQMNYIKTGMERWHNKAKDLEKYFFKDYLPLTADIAKILDAKNDVSQKIDTISGKITTALMQKNKKMAANLERIKKDLENKYSKLEEEENALKVKRDNVLDKIHELIKKPAFFEFRILKVSAPNKSETLELLFDIERAADLPQPASVFPTRTPRPPEEETFPKIVTMPEGTRIYRYEDGKIVRVHRDGSTAISLPDGTIHNEYPSGVIITRYPDGETTLWKPPSYTVTLYRGYEYEGDKPENITFSDGNGLVYPNGSIVLTRPDGSREVLPAGGVYSIIELNGPQPSRTGEDATEPERITEYADGSIREWYPDGRHMTRFPDGTDTFSFPDGTAFGLTPDGVRIEAGEMPHPLAD